MHAIGDGRHDRAWPFVALAVVALSLFVICIAVLPDLLISWDVDHRKLSPPELAKATNDIRATLIQALGGIVLMLGAYLTWRQTQISRLAGRDQLELARQGMLTDRFTRAVDQLGHEAVSVRCGGIFALERITRETPDNLPSVVQILTAHVRNQAPWPQADGSRTMPIEKIPMLSRRAPDVQAALTVLGRRAAMPRDHRFWITLDLSAVDLRRAQLQNADLRNTRLRGANLTKAWLTGADLRGADLREAILDGASMRGAKADATTWWPDASFNPGAYGIHVEPHLVGADLGSAARIGDI